MFGWLFGRRRPTIRAKITSGAKGKYGATIYGKDGDPLFVTAINSRSTSKYDVIAAIREVSEARIEIVSGPDLG